MCYRTEWFKVYEWDLPSYHTNYWWCGALIYGFMDDFGTFVSR